MSGVRERVRWGDRGVEGWRDESMMVLKGKGKF
jgi:hypothetical protein